MRQFRCVRHSFFFVGHTRLNCRIIESIFDMSLVYLHTCKLVKSFMSRTFAASNFPFSNFRLVTSKICYFEFRYLEFSRKIVTFSLKTPRNIFRKFDDFSWKIRENKGRISKNFVCITFAQYCISIRHRFLIHCERYFFSST